MWCSTYYANNNSNWNHWYDVNNPRFVVSKKSDTVGNKHASKDQRCSEQRLGSEQRNPKVSIRSIPRVAAFAAPEEPIENFRKDADQTNDHNEQRAEAGHVNAASPVQQRRRKESRWQNRRHNPKFRNRVNKPRNPRLYTKNYFFWFWSIWLIRFWLIWFWLIWFWLIWFWLIWLIWLIWFWLI